MSGPFDRWRYPHMQSHELWQPSSFRDAAYTLSSLMSLRFGGGVGISRTEWDAQVRQSRTAEPTDTEEKSS